MKKIFRGCINIFTEVLVYFFSNTFFFHFIFCAYGKNVSKFIQEHFSHVEKSFVDLYATFNSSTRKKEKTAKEKQQNNPAESKKYHNSKEKKKNKKKKYKQNKIKQINQQKSNKNLKKKCPPHPKKHKR